MPRRTLLLAGLGVTAGLSGCTSPTIDRGGSGTGSGTGRGGTSSGGTGAQQPGASTTPVTGASEAAATETRLTALTIGVLAKKGDEAPSTRQQAILAQIRDAHLDHLRALGTADPTRPSGTDAGADPTTPSPSPAPSSLKDAISALVSAETTAADGYRRRMVGTQGDLALFWASMMAADQSHARALGSDQARSGTAAGRQRSAPTAVTAAQALAQLLAQVDAALYGYEAGLARLSGSAASRASKRITGLYQLRDTVTAKIAAGGGQPSPAAAVYVLDPKPTTLTAAHRLLAGMETRLQPYLGQWLTSATGPDLSTASSALSTAVSAGLDWGGPLDRWPGYP